MDYQIEKNLEILSKKDFLDNQREQGKGTIFYKKKELSKSFEISITKVIDKILTETLLLPGSRERQQDGKDYRILY